MPLSHHDLAGRIMVALDFPSAEAAEKLLEQIRGIPCYIKVGMELFYAAGPQFLTKLKKNGHRIFLDLKLHDIPNTVKGAARSIARLGVDMFNVHAAGGGKMMEAALDGVREALEESGRSVGEGEDEGPLVIAVTQLTSTSRSVLNDEIGIAGSVEDAVLRYADLARRSGLHGVVASALETAAIKRRCGGGFIAVTPGIRPAGAERGDQSRVMTPSQAFAEGSDFIVIGRPVTKAPDPRQALEQIIDDLRR